MCYFGVFYPLLTIPQKHPKIDPYFDPQMAISEKPAKTCLFLPHFDACFWTCPEYPQIRPILTPKPGPRQAPSNGTLPASHMSQTQKCGNYI